MHTRVNHRRAPLRLLLGGAAIWVAGALAGCGGSGAGTADAPVPSMHSVADRGCPGGAVATYAASGTTQTGARAGSTGTGGAVAGGTVSTTGGGAGAGGETGARARTRGAVFACPYRGVRVLGNVGEGVFRQPEAIAVGPQGRVYVADQFSHKVQTFSAQGHYEGEWGAYGSGPGEFGAVGGLSVAANGDLYLADCANDRIEVFTGAGRFIRAWGKSGSGIGQFHLGAGTGPAEPPGGGVAVGRRYVYVADTLNNRIQRFSLEGTQGTVVAGPGTAAGQVRRPKGLAVGAAYTAPTGTGSAPEALYVADNGNGRVQELGLDGRFMAEASSFAAEPPTFQNAYDVAAQGRYVYVVDDNHGRIVQFTRALHFVGTFTGDGEDRLSSFPRAIATDAIGRVYVADAHDNDVVVFDRMGTAIDRWGISSNDPGQFVDPVDIALGPSHEGLVVERYAGLLHLHDLASLAHTINWSSGGEVFLGSLWFSPSAAAFAPNGSVWVTDINNNDVRNITYPGRFLDAAGDPHGAGAPAAPGAPGYAAPSEPGAAGGPVRFAALLEPTGLAVQRSGDVLIADGGANDVLVLSPQGATVAVWRAKSLGGLRDPHGIGVAPNGTVYVADTGHHRVVVLGPSGKPLAAIGGPGGAAGSFASPTGIAVDSAGSVFVSDAALDRIEEFSPGGRLVALWGREGPGAGELSSPAGLDLDCQGELLVADSANNRIQVFRGFPAAAGCSG